MKPGIIQTRDSSDASRGVPMRGRSVGAIALIAVALSLLKPSALEGQDFLCGDFCPIDIVHGSVASGYFGSSILSMPDGTIVIGGHSPFFSNGGNATVIPVNDPDNPIPIGNPTPDLNASFGVALAALDGERFFVGAPGVDDGANTQVGRVFLYSTAGNLIIPILDPEPQPGDRFGSSLATLGAGLIAVGAPTRTVGTTPRAGAVFLMDADGSHVLTINNPSPQEGDRFGDSLSKLGDDRLLVGTPSGSNNGAGRVYIYQTDGTLLRAIGSPEPPTVNFSSGFGDSVTEVGLGRFVVTQPFLGLTTLLPGQVSETTTYSLAGKIYLFDGDGSLLREIPNPEASTALLFGYSVARLGEGRFAVGTHRGLNPREELIATVYVYNVDGERVASLRKREAIVRDQFGASVAGIGENQLVVGAPESDIGASNTGSIYYYDLSVPEYNLGQEIPRPDGVALSDIPASGPEIDPPDAAFWHRPSALEARLYATRPGKITIRWNERTTLVANNVWPQEASAYQFHVADCPPVDLSAQGRFSTTHLLYSEPAVGSDSNQTRLKQEFVATGPGSSLLIFSENEDLHAGPIYFQLVQSVVWNTAGHLQDSIPAVVGSEIVEFFGLHDADLGAPLVFWPNSYYCADEGYYDRSSRTGPIIPVNINLSSSEEDDMVLVFYEKSTSLVEAVSRTPLTNDIGWPWQSVRYNVTWPSSPESNVIANLCDKPVVNPAIYQDWDIYVQNDPGKPGFNPNDEHALKLPWNAAEAIFPLRDDLGSPSTSQPYVLMKYRNTDDRHQIKVFRVVATTAQFPFVYPALVGSLLQAPFPLSLFQTETEAVSGPYWTDRNGSHWVRAAGDNGGTANITMRHRYPMQASFYSPGLPPPSVGDLVPWLDVRAGTPGAPIGIIYEVIWPDRVIGSPCGLGGYALPELRIGETLATAKNGLPDIRSQSSAEILYQQASALSQRSAHLIDPTIERRVALAQLPPDVATVNEGGFLFFPDLPPHLRTRFFYDPVSRELKFRGQYVDEDLGEDYLLLNIITDRERAILLDLVTGNTHPDAGAFRTAVNALATDLVEVDSATTALDSMALTAGAATGIGYVVVAFGSNTLLSAPEDPVSIEVIKVVCPLYHGEVKSILSLNAFDEKLTLRHSGDFAGRADQYRFQWYRASPAPDGSAPSLPTLEGNGTVNDPRWSLFAPDPANGVGALDVTLQGPGLQTLIDQYFICRYQPVNGSAFVCGSQFTAFTVPKLAEGWIKRVLRAIDPFEQRIKEYRSNQVNTIVSMIGQAGPPWVGNVALNGNAANEFGLIELYQTVLNRGIALSIEASPPVIGHPEVDSALMLAAGRIAELYMLLGNEAYADAADPTIAFGTDDGQYGAEATSLHSFQNQTASLLEEELGLLRGRDASRQPGVQLYPVFNRLVWNFTRDITGGEVAYALNYNIRNEDGDITGTIEEGDARTLYPQGHGDAWGHYLTAVKTYYRLLQHPNFAWVTRGEAVEIGGTQIDVDYFDERKFAESAAAKARTGAEVVNLTYRNLYYEDPSNVWHDYSDDVVQPKSNHPAANTNAKRLEPRAWGLTDWACRAGQGALFDWVVGNAILPSESDREGIQKIDRSTVLALREIPAVFQDIEAKLDTADQGLNPLGLAASAIPFDVDPAQVEQGRTHFEQIFDRAVLALNNAIGVFDYANNSTQRLRRQADSVAGFQIAVNEREVDFNSRLVEIFGYPYPNDIGPGGAYPSGYDGPDIYHFDYFDPSKLLGIHTPTQSVDLAIHDPAIDDFGRFHIDPSRRISFNFSMTDLGLVKPASWTGKRRAPGEIQLARSEVLQVKARLERALDDYDTLLERIDDQVAILQAQYGINADVISVLDEQKNTVISLNDSIRRSHSLQLEFLTAARVAVLVANGTAELLPLVAGVAVDVTSVARGTIRILGSVISEALNQAANSEAEAQTQFATDKELLQHTTSLRLEVLRQTLPVLQQVAQIEQLVRQEPAVRREILINIEVLGQSSGRYAAALARGQRLLEDRLRFRQQTATQIQEYRYKDMAFRIFRSDALQKYRAQFDLAALYVCLAAKAYDYETCLLDGDPRGPGKDAIRDIIRSRSLGIIQGGFPQPGNGRGDPGLADPLAQMFLNWELALKGQLGFNNPQVETGRFSLRTELFRILHGSDNNALWRDTLSDLIVPNILDHPDFQRYCIPFYPQRPEEPAIVIPFTSTVNFGQNLFGWPAGGGDNSYDSSHFATKVHSVGVWFANYHNLSGGMVDTPRVYLIPVGLDVMRSPTGHTGAIREFRVIDQLIPVPFPSVGYLFDPYWIPMHDGLFDEYGAIRKYPSLRAFHDSGAFEEDETISNTRLIGRSVWNRQWLLIIPAGTLHSDREEGLERFINGPLGSDGRRTGQGVTDIKLFFSTYAYSGN